MPDFRLLDSQLPLKVQAPDVIGAMDRGYKLSGDRADTQEKLRARAAADQDRAVIEELTKSGEFDISKPEGLEGLWKKASGRLSPETNMKFSEKITAAKESDARLQSVLQKSDKDFVTMMDENEDALQPPVKNLLDTYERDKNAKGEQFARQEYDKNKGAMIQSLGGQKLPNGKPRFFPQILEKYAGMDPELMSSTAQGSPYRSALIKNRLEEMRAKDAEAQAEARRNPGNWEMYVDPQGNLYRFNSKLSTGNWQAHDRPSDTYNTIGAPPPNVRPLKQQPRMSPFGQLMADYKAREASGQPMSDKEKAAWEGAVDKASGISGTGEAVSGLDPDERQWLSEYMMNGGKVPSVPLGSGAASTPARKLLLKDFVRIGMASTPDGSEAGQKQLEIAAARESLKKIQTQDALLLGAEKTVKKVFPNIEAEIKKLGGPNSELLRKHWATGMQQLLGDPRFVGLNSYFAELQEGMSRIASNATGAGATPVGYLTLSQSFGNKNMNLGEWYEAQKAMDNLINNRQTSTKEVQRYLLDSIKVEGAPKGVLKKPESDEKKAYNTEPTDPKPLQDFYDKSLSDYTGGKIKPGDRAKALADLRKTRQALITMGIKVPEIKEIPADVKKKSYSTLWAD